MFEYNKTVDLTAGNEREKKLNETRFCSLNSQVQEKKSQETNHNFF